MFCKSCDCKTTLTLLLLLYSLHCQQRFEIRRRLVGGDFLQSRIRKATFEVNPKTQFGSHDA